mgnify:CR=1 FL=1
MTNIAKEKAFLESFGVTEVSDSEEETLDTDSDSDDQSSDNETKNDNAKGSEIWKNGGEKIWMRRTR